MSVANQDAAKTLLMKCYLNKGAFINRASPTFDDADMQQVITIGNSIITSENIHTCLNTLTTFSVRTEIH